MGAAGGGAERRTAGEDALTVTETETKIILPDRECLRKVGGAWRR